jgi:hypothetical protein
MGFSSSNKTTTSDRTATSNNTIKPVYEGQILGANNNLQGAFDANQGNLMNIQGQLSGLVPQAVQNYQNNPTLGAANGYVQHTLNDPYSSNGLLDNVLKYSNADVANGTTAALGTRGLSGGSVAAKIISGQLAKNDAGMRYQDYNNWQNRQSQAAGMAPGLSAAQDGNLSSLLALSDRAANLSTDNATKRAIATGGLLGQYTNSNGTATEHSKSKEESTPSAMNQIGKGLQIATLLLSDARLKENIRHVGSTNEGLPIYLYNYKGANQMHMGVMAQEVAQMQPNALGPIIQGFGSVNYAEVR